MSWGGNGAGGRIRIDAPCEGVCRLQAAGVLDGHTGARMLRCVDARLQLVAAGHHATRHLLIDLSEVVGASAAGVRALPHAHYAATRRGISLHLIAADRLHPTLSTADRAHLRRLNGVPDLDAALATVHPRCTRCTPEPCPAPASQA